MYNDAFAPTGALDNLGANWLYCFLNELSPRLAVGKYARYDINVVGALEYVFEKKSAVIIDDSEQLFTDWRAHQEVFRRYLHTRIQELAMQLYEIKRQAYQTNCELTNLRNKRELALVEAYACYEKELYLGNELEASVYLKKYNVLSYASMAEINCQQKLEALKAECQSINSAYNAFCAAIRCDFQIVKIYYSGKNGRFRVKLTTAEERKRASAEHGAETAEPVLT